MSKSQVLTRRVACDVRHIVQAPHFLSACQIDTPITLLLLRNRYNCPQNVMYFTVANVRFIRILGSRMSHPPAILTV